MAHLGHRVWSTLALKALKWVPMWHSGFSLPDSLLLPASSRILNITSSGLHAAWSFMPAICRTDILKGWVLWRLVTNFKFPWKSVWLPDEDAPRSGGVSVTWLWQRCTVRVRITAVCDHCNYRDQDLHSIYHRSARSRISHTGPIWIMSVSGGWVWIQ